MTARLALLALTLAALVAAGLTWDDGARAQFYDGGGGGYGYCDPSQAGTVLPDGHWCGYFCDGWHSNPPHVCSASYPLVWRPE